MRLKAIARRFVTTALGNYGISVHKCISGMVVTIGKSGFIFLRLICPAILSPRLFGLVRGTCLENVFWILGPITDRASKRTDQPDVRTTRSLTLLAKCLMSLANLVDPSLKEPWMSFLHQFIMVRSFECRYSAHNISSV
jgi:hypothetical protein